MNEQNIARLEAQLERLVEGTFANLFGKKIRAQDIALELARAMESGIKAASGRDPRPLAPDQYIIYLNPDVQAQLFQRQPALIELLSQHMVELATYSGYRLTNTPLIKVLADARLDTHRLAVKAAHTNRPENSTAILQKVEIKGQKDTPRNPQLIINQELAIQLNEPVVNIGRHTNNHIVIDDPFVSRHHVQLRLRSGRYLLFDVNSQGGTFVNDVKIKEYSLQAGDVIRIGKTQLIYIEDEPLDDIQSDITEIIDAVPRDNDS